jgi:transposase
VKTERKFLSEAERSELLEIARDGLEEHRVARRANALLLLDDGMGYGEIARVLFLDDSTVRSWRKAYREGGVDNLIMFDLKGGLCALTGEQVEKLRGWAALALPRTTAQVGAFVKAEFGVDYGRSGLIKLMGRISFVWRKPEAIPANSGRKRLNLHGAIDLETGMTRIVEVEVVDAMSTIALFEALERAYPAMRRIHVFLDNARYHKAVLVRQWLAQPGRRIVPHFVPPYCPHPNPIERLRLPRFRGRFASLQIMTWSGQPPFRLRRSSATGSPGPNAAVPGYTNPRCS